MRTKICGINTWENAKTALDCGADALGFLVGITHLAEDKIEVVDAKKIIEKLPPFVSTVAVTHLRDPQKIIEMCKYLGVTSLQIHDYISPEEVALCRAELQGVKIIKAVHVIDGDKFGTIETARSFEGVADALLLDSRTAERLGGTGKTHDWNISREIVERLNIPVMLAGGLTDKNVYDAVMKVKPYAVDVNSGVETDGDKDWNKVYDFISNAKKAEYDYRSRNQL